MANITITPTSLSLLYREINLETHRIPCPPAKYLQGRLPPLYINEYMMGLDEDLEKHTAYMDQYILERLVELTAVMNEYLCSPVRKQYMANLLFRRRTYFGNHAAPQNTSGDTAYLYYAAITFHNLWKRDFGKSRYVPA